MLEQHGGAYNPQPGVALDIPNVDSSPATAWNAYYTQPPHIEGGSCSPTASESIAPASFGRTVFTCTAELDSLGCNDDQWCLPSQPAYDEQLCVWQPGDIACPEATNYTDRHVTYQDVADNRSCTSCSCGDPTGTCEDASVRLLSTQAFTHQVELETSSICDLVYPHELGNHDISAILFDPGDPVASCSPTGGNPTGSAAGVEAITVCCTP